MIRKTLTVLALTCSMAAFAAPQASTPGQWHNTVHPIPTAQPANNSASTNTASTTSSSSSAKPASASTSSDKGSGDQWNNTVHPIPAPKNGNTQTTSSTTPPKK